MGTVHPAAPPEHTNFQAVWDILRGAGEPCGDGSLFHKDQFKEIQARR